MAEHQAQQVRSVLAADVGGKGGVEGAGHDRGVGERASGVQEPHLFLGRLAGVLDGGVPIVAIGAPDHRPDRNERRRHIGVGGASIIEVTVEERVGPFDRRLMLGEQSERTDE